MDIAPALNAYGHPPIPPPFSKPVRWMVWSKPDPKVERSSNHGSSDSFGEDLDKVDGIEKLSKHGLKILQQKCQQLENDIIRETEKCCFEKAKNEKLVGLLNNSKNQTMTAVGDMVRRNDVLDQKLQAVKKRMAEIENESTLATEQAHSDAARRIRDLRKVIQGRLERLKRFFIGRLFRSVCAPLQQTQKIDCVLQGRTSNVSSRESLFEVTSFRG